MSKQKSPCNELIYREVRPVPPPINLDVTSHGKPSQCEENLPSLAIKLIRRLLTLADADNTEVSIQDREWLYSMLTQTIEALKTENGYLHSVVNAYSEKELKPTPETLRRHPLGLI